LSELDCKSLDLLEDNSTLTKSSNSHCVYVLSSSKYLLLERREKRIAESPRYLHMERPNHKIKKEQKEWANQLDSFKSILIFDRTLELCWRCWPPPQAEPGLGRTSYAGSPSPSRVSGGGDLQPVRDMRERDKQRETLHCEGMSRP
jgi:hypothetical protein